ncbi:MAG: hypothetical protein L0Y72_24595 [Gemmataceae bacterium]|nr:hypothetical protein [Gemmataceae bacterium]MCI0742226.1 hypothetical protein [Gemmataceae bacterium]
MVFVFGFILLVGGIAVLVLGELPWFGGRKVPQRNMRQVGILLVSFFPAVFVMRFIHSKLGADDLLPAAALHWSLAAIWLIAAWILVYRAVGEKTAHQGAQTLTPASNPFGAAATDSQLAAPNTSNAPKQFPSSPAKQQGKSPFDFS